MLDPVFLPADEGLCAPRLGQQLMGVKNVHV